MIFGKWLLRGDYLNSTVAKWESEGLDKRRIASELVRYQTEALRWENEYKQLCVEARRAYQREGIIPTTLEEWDYLLMKLEPSAFFRNLVEPTWPDIESRRAMAYFDVGMEILDDTEATLKNLGFIPLRESESPGL